MQDAHPVVRYLILALLSAGCGDIKVPPAPVEDTSQPTTCQTDEDCASKTCLTVACQDDGTCGTPVQKPNTCYTAETCYAPNQEKPGDRCMVCVPETDPAGFSPVVCEGGLTCDPESGECKDAITDDGTPPDADDTDQPEVVDPDVEDVVGPDNCESNADCKGQIELGECEGAVCIKETGDCTTIELVEGSPCAPLEADNPECFKGACDADGKCLASPISDVGCDDGNACTQSDLCQEGLCVGASKDCSDGNSCTIDSCDEASGGCSSEPAPDGGEAEPCDDGNPCTVDDGCEGGE